MISQRANNNDNSVLIPNNQFPFLLWRNQLNCILNCILLYGILTNNWHEPRPVVNLFYDNIIALNSIVLLNAEYYYIFKAAHAQTEETLSQRNYIYLLRWMDQWTVLPARHRGALYKRLCCKYFSIKRRTAKLKVGIMFFRFRIVQYWESADSQSDLIINLYYIVVIFS